VSKLLGWIRIWALEHLSCKIPCCLSPLACCVITSSLTWSINPP
jgi:hypothetical protein